MIRPLLFSITLIASPFRVEAQQWYCQNENNGEGLGYNCTGGVSFIAGGKGFFGHGLDYSGQPSGYLTVYDPVTNTTVGPGAETVPRAYSTGFGIGNNAYVGLGLIAPGDQPFDPPPFHPDFFYCFNAGTGAFVDIVVFPGGMRRNAIAFTIGDVAYVGGGTDVDPVGGVAQFTPATDLWAYDQGTHLWTPKADLPTTFTTAHTFTINGKGYLMRDNSTSLWEYDPVADTWTARAPFPGGNRTGFSAFALNGSAYVGCGRTTSDHKDFFAFDPTTNTWSPAPPIWDDLGRSHALAFTIDDSGYLLGGVRGANPIRDGVWRFGPASAAASGAWIQRPFLPAAGRTGAIAFSIGEKGYVGGGGSNTDFWEYDPATMQWTARAPLPGPVEEGFSIGGLGYVTRNTATANFHAYDPSTNTWSLRADLPGGARSAAASFAVEGKGYVCSGQVNGSAQNDLWEYDPATNAWTQRANRPNSPTFNAMGMAIGNKGYVMGGSQNSSTGVSWNHQYDPATDTWTTKASVPFGSRRNGQVFAVGNMGYLGGGWAGSTAYQKRLDVYNPATNSWALVGDMGGGYRHDGVGFAIGEKGFLFGGRGSMSSVAPGSSAFYVINDLWEFNPVIIGLNARVILDGPYDDDTQLMTDGLRAAGMLPLRDPYALSGYPFPGGGYGDIQVIPATRGGNAVVDRIVVELRDAVNPSQILATRHVWLQRDGDIVDMDGSSPVRFTMPPGGYHVAIRHRNHLGLMSAAPTQLGSTPISLDFASPATATYGTLARRIQNGVARAWCGDVSFNGDVKYTGSGNDRDLILLRVGGVVPTNTVTGYFPEDVNLDGQVKYVGSQNDRDLILLSIGGVVLSSVRTEQLP